MCAVKFIARELETIPFDQSQSGSALTFWEESILIGDCSAEPADDRTGAVPITLN